MIWRTALLSILLTACAGGEASLGTARDNIDSTDPTCSSLTPAQLHDAAMDVFTNQVFNPQSCFGDTICPCGSYCSSDDSVCEVECVPTPAPGEPTCAAGKACTTSGRCADAPNTPPPALAMSIAFGDPATSANTTTAAVSLPIQVTTSAISIGALDDAEAATVHFSIQEFREQQLGLISDPPPVFPLIKCTSTGTFANECDLVGGWSYNVTSGAIRSQPRTIWVQVPQTALPLHWTLEARSANASGTSAEVINATPVVTPATDPGHYKGTLSYANGDASHTIAVPVEAAVTSAGIAVLEPTKLLFADGNAVVARSTSKATQLGWLGAATGRYDVILQYTDAAYDATRGHLDVNLDLLYGTGADSTSVTLSLDRTGDNAACPCASGSYCNTDLGTCVSGTAPTDQSFVVSGTTASTTLASASVAAWTPVVKNAAMGSSVLNGSGLTGFGEAYCYNGSAIAGTIFGSTTMSTVSGDMECQHGASFLPQTTFHFEEQPTEFNDGTAGGSAFDLFQTCLQDLATTPSGNTLATLFPSRACVNLGQFFLALGAHDPNVPMADIDQRLVMQLLRQWLGVTAYVANTAVQGRDYNDALSITGAPAYVQLGGTLDQVDSDLRVLLDPEVVPQYATGDSLGTVLADPDYRIRPRPLARWSFNTAGTPGVDAEGHNSLIISGASLQGSQLVAEGQPGSACRSSNTLPSGERRYSIVLALDFNSPGGTVTVFVKRSRTDYLRVDASPGSGIGVLNLRMYDNLGGSVTFPNVPSGLIAISVDGNHYALYSAPQADPTHVATIASQTVVNGGPIWGAAGAVELNCNLPPDPNVCTSWDRNVPGDGLDYATHVPYVVHSATSTWECKTLNTKPDAPQCIGSQPTTQTCTNTATAMRTSLQNQIRAISVNPLTSPPAGPLAALTTHGSVAEVGDVLGSGHGFTTETIQWRCDTTVTGYISPITAAKLVCSEPLKARYDEVSVWDRPVQPAEVADMAQRYMGIASNDSMPLIIDPAGNEQASALPVHLLEAAAADLELLATYAGAEQAQAYGECYLGGHSAALDRLAQRGGPNLRLVSLLEDEADHLLALGGGTSATWYPRYAAAKQQLAGRRSLAVQAILEATKCENPLGITEHDIPLYVGEDVGANAEFFASSHYLADQASNEIATATGLLSAARTAYTNQRQQAYQLDESAATKQDRLADLRANVESQLSHYCGSAQGSTSLFDALQTGTLTDNNCFIDRVLPQCVSFATATFESLPAECLRGELGNQVLAIKTADLVMTNADNTIHDTIARYDGDLEHCAQEQAAFDEDETILQDHDQEMEKLHNEQALFDSLVSGVKAGMDFANPFGLANPEAEFHSAMDTLGFISGFGDSQFAIKEQEETDSYNEEVAHRSHEETLANCFHDTDNEKYQIDNARDQLLLAKQQFENATHQLSVDFDQVGSITAIAQGQIATEATLTATPPHLHFWLDQSISDYHSHLEAARRLTYLALRALEYEAQISLDLRSATLTATVPSALQTVVTDIRAVNAPLAGALGVSINDKPIVLSLREEILKISQSTANVAGDLVLTPVEQFQRYLRSSSSIFLDANGKVIGRGIRFAITPDAWNSIMCDERIWRILPSLQIDGPPTQHPILLYQDNTFGSQDCRAALGTVLVTHANPSGNLLLDNTFALPTLALPEPYVASDIDGLPGLDHETLKLQPESTVTTFAGRGLYSNYVLVFPQPLWSDADIENVKDVLLRFDISYAPRAPSL